MNYTLDNFNGYEKGKRYEKRLSFVKMLSYSRNRYITMKDETGQELQWETTDKTKAFQTFKKEGEYRFTVDYIIEHQKQIGINFLKVVDKQGELKNRC